MIEPAPQRDLKETAKHCLVAAGLLFSVVLAFAAVCAGTHYLAQFRLPGERQDIGRNYR